METTIEIAAETQTLEEFAEHAERFIEQIRLTKQPMILTVDGKAVVVVQDPESFQSLAESGEYLRTVEVLKPAIADMEYSDRWVDSKDAFEMVRERNRG